MVSLNADVVHLASVGQIFQANVIVIVEVSSVQRQDVLVLSIHSLEPCSLLGIDHSILVEHNQHGSVQARESGLSEDRVVSTKDSLWLLVVEGGKEHTIFLILVHVADITEVTSGGDHILDLLDVNQFLGNHVDSLAHDSIRTVGDGIDSHVGSSEGQHVSDGSWHVALLDDVSGKETSLRKSNDVELSLEIFDGCDLLTRFLGDSLEVSDHLANRWGTDFNAVSGSVSSLAELFSERAHSWVDASISKSMEHSGGSSFVLGGIPGGLLNGLWIVEGRVVVLLLVLEHLHEGALVVLLLVLLPELLDHLLSLLVGLLDVLKELLDGALVVLVLVLVVLFLDLFLVRLLGLGVLLTRSDLSENSPVEDGAEMPWSLDGVVVVIDVVLVSEWAVHPLGGSEGSGSEDQGLLTEHLPRIIIL